jgi:hypothetical protein
MAQSRGITFSIDKEDDPLVEAQMALQIAERMSEQGRELAAKANLQLARNQLELYRGLLAKDESEHVRKLQSEIAKLQGDMGRKDAADTIRGFWDRVASWFTQQPGDMRVTTKETKKEERSQSEATRTAKR